MMNYGQLQTCRSGENLGNSGTARIILIEEMIGLRGIYQCQIETGKSNKHARCRNQGEHEGSSILGRWWWGGGGGQPALQLRSPHPFQLLGLCLRIDPEAFWKSLPKIAKPRLFLKRFRLGGRVFRCHPLSSTWVIFLRAPASGRRIEQARESKKQENNSHHDIETGAKFLKDRIPR